MSGRVPPDPDAYAAPPGTGIGHVHLRVADLERAIAFYAGVLGFALQQRIDAGGWGLPRDAVALHEPNREGVLEPGYGAGDRGLADPEPAGRSAEGARLGERREGPQPVGQQELGRPALHALRDPRAPPRRG